MIDSDPDSFAVVVSMIIVPRRICAVVRVRYLLARQQSSLEDRRSGMGIDDGVVLSNVVLLLDPFTDQ